MALVRKPRVITREDAIKLVQKMLHKGIVNYIIRDALTDRGLTVQEANEIIREVRQADLEASELPISPQIVGMGLAIITAIIALIVLFLLIIPAQ